MGKIFFRFFLSNLKKILVVFVLVLTLIFPYALFGDACAAFLLNYKNINRSDFQNAYVLNYPLDLNGLYAYPNTDFVVYKNYRENEKLFVSTFMQLENQNYKDSYLLSGSDLRENEILLSAYTMAQNDLNIGDIVYLKVPVSNDVIEYTIKGELDCMDYFSDYNLKIGVCIIGFSQEYISNLDMKYFVQSSNSLSKLLSQQPQVLNRAYDRTELIVNGFIQLTPLFILYCLIFILTTIVYNKLIFSRIKEMIIVLRNKGFSIKKLCVIKHLAYVFVVIFPFFTCTMLLNCLYGINSFAIIICGLLIFTSLLILSVFAFMNAVLLRRRNGARDRKS